MKQIPEIPKIVFRTILSLFFLTESLFFTGIQAQNAPVTTIASVGNALPGSVSVPLIVTGFSNIGACSLCFDYDYAGLHYLQAAAHPSLAGCAIGDASLGNGKHRVTIGWFGSGLSLPAGTTLVTITFTYIGGNTALEFYDNGPSCEYADGAYNVLNDIPQSTYYINGYVCGQLSNPGTITGSQNICLGQTAVAYSVNTVTSATSYSWTVPSGASVMNGAGTSSILVDFNPGSVSGDISVAAINACGSGPVSQLPVTVNALPVANAGPDISIPYGTSTLLTAASGGTGTFGYHWTPESLLVNPNLQQVQTVNLTVSTVFTLKVTNQSTLCNTTDEVVVTITGGPLNANPVALQTSLCNGSSTQLFANAGGGSGNYTYAWTCTPAGVPPWTSSLANPVVSPTVTTVYHLAVNDGFNSASGNTTVTVFPLPTATLSGGDTLCGPGNFTILSIDLTGTPPWSFYYTNGVTTWLVSSQMSTPYLVQATEPGIYTVLAVSDAHCTGTMAGAAIVAVYPVPPTPVLSVNGTDLFSTGCCGNQWYRNGIPVPGANGQTYTPVLTADYYDIVTVNGCASDTSNTLHFIMAGAGETDPWPGLRLEPNPAHGDTRLIAEADQPGSKEITIHSITGKTVSHIYRESDGGKELWLDLGDLAPGLYFVCVRNTRMMKVLKLLVN